MRTPTQATKAASPAPVKAPVKAAEKPLVTSPSAPVPALTLPAMATIAARPSAEPT